MIRLTKTMREAIRKNIIKATTLPEERKAIIQEEKELAREFAKNQIPKEFSELIKNAPKEWFSYTNHVYLVSDSAEEIMNANGGCCVSFDPIPCPTNFCPRRTKETLPTYKKALDWKKRYDELNSELTGVLYRYQTLEKLLKEHPYFEKHVPEIEKKQYSIVANDANMIASLNRAGYKFEGETK